MRTSYSRRELYALGEPLGNSATYLKAGGGLILGDGGGGGGGSAPSNTTSTSTQTAELPEWARGYAKDVLAKGAALTDINQNPYQTYNQPRIAGFTPMQQAAQQGAANMGVSKQLGTGTNLATASGQGGLGIAASANPENFQSQVGGYMNPYMKNVLDPQMAEMRRQYGISGTQQAGAATQAGAFGGSRDAIMAAENQRNLGTAQNQAIGQAYGNAFNAAQNQYNQGQNQALQGMQLAGQNAATLGQLGQQDYTQKMGINQLQNQYGTQQQAQTQQGLTQGYQDFINQQNYPYKQLGFMSDMIRGMPLGQQSTAAVYQPPPSTAQTIGSLGLGAYGIGQLFKAEGGQVHGYAAGGLGGTVPRGSVMTREFKEDAVNQIPDERSLQTAQTNAANRSDFDTELAAKQKMAQDAAIRGQSAAINRGIAGQLPEQFADNVVRAAKGGILAFAAPTAANNYSLTNSGEGEGDGDGQTIQVAAPAGDPALYRQFGRRAMSSIDAYSNLQAPKPYTPEEEEALDARSMARARKLIGPSPTEGIKAELEDLKTQSKEALQQGKGLAALSAMEGMLQPGGALRGLGRAGKNFVEAYAPAVRADQDLRKSTALMNINLANAQRAENMGLGKEAMAYTNQAAAARKEAGKAERELALKEAELNLKGATAFRPPSKGSGGAGGGQKEYVYATQKYLPKIKAMYPTMPPDQQEAAAYQLYQQNKSAGLEGANVRANSAENLKAQENFNNELNYGVSAAAKAYRAADKAGNEPERQRLRNQIAKEQGYTLPDGAPANSGGGGGAGNAPPLPPGFNPVR